MNKFLTILTTILIVSFGAFGCASGQSKDETAQYIAKIEAQARDNERLKLENERLERVAGEPHPERVAAAKARAEAGDEAAEDTASYDGGRRLLGLNRGVPGTQVLGTLGPAPLAGSVGPSVGYLNRDPLDGRPCGGMCLAIKNQSPYWAHVIIDGREMVRLYNGFQGVLAPTNAAKIGGGRQASLLPLVPPGEMVKTVMDGNGKRSIRVVLYNRIPGQAYLQPVGMWEDRIGFPYREGPTAYAWGAVRTVYNATRGIETY